MHFTITIPQGLPEMTVKELLEEHFLIPRKIRHFLRIKKHVFVNQKAINWQSIIHPHDKITLIFDEEDYPEKSILMGKANLVEELYQDEHIIISSHGNLICILLSYFDGQIHYDFWKQLPMPAILILKDDKVYLQ